MANDVFNGKKLDRFVEGEPLSAAKLNQIVRVFNAWLTIQIVRTDVDGLLLSSTNSLFSVKRNG